MSKSFNIKPEDIYWSIITHVTIFREIPPIPLEKKKIIEHMKNPVAVTYRLSYHFFSFQYCILSYYSWNKEEDKMFDYIIKSGGEGDQKRLVVNKLFWLYIIFITPYKNTLIPNQNLKKSLTNQ